MSVISTVPEHKIYRCDICGEQGPWGATWSRYSSILLDEECPNDVPHACSEKCRQEVSHRVKTGVFVLPVLKMRGYSVIRKSEKRGYGDTPHPKSAAK